MLILMALLKCCAAWQKPASYIFRIAFKTTASITHLPLSLPLDTTIFCARQPSLFHVRVISKAEEVISKKRNCPSPNTVKTLLFFNKNFPRPCSVIQALPVFSTICTCPISLVSVSCSRTNLTGSAYKQYFCWYIIIYGLHDLVIWPSLLPAAPGKHD